MIFACRLITLTILFSLVYFPVLLLSAKDMNYKTGFILSILGALFLGVLSGLTLLITIPCT